MYDPKDWEEFHANYTPTREYSEPIESILAEREAMEFKEKQTAWDKTLNVGKSAINGALIDPVGGIVNFARGLRDVNIEQLNRDNPERAQADPAAIAVLDDIANSSILQPFEVKADSAAEQYVYDLARGAGQLAWQIPASMATGPVGAGVIMGAQIAGQDYKELREQGVDPETALIAGAADAAVQAPLENIGLGAMTRAFPANTLLKQRMRTWALNAAKEGLTEFAQQYPDEITKIWAQNKDKSWDEIAQIILDELPGITGRGIYAGSLGFFLGGGVSGANLALDHAFGQHIERSMERAAQRENHALMMEHAEGTANRIKESGETPARAAVIINNDLQNETAYIDGEALQGYAQEAGMEEVAESLGVTVEEIQTAAANGDTVDVRLGNFEATGAAFEGFFQAVQDDTAFEDGGYTPNKEKQEIEEAKAREEMRSAVEAELDRIDKEFEAAKVNRSIRTGQRLLLLSRAYAANPDNPAEFLKKYNVRPGEAGGAAGYAQFAGEHAKTADQPAFQRALSMLWSGKTAEEIFKETGWFQSKKDGGWRFEIPDDLSKIDYSKLNKRGVSTLQKIYDNPALFEAYPFLKKVRVVATEFEDADYRGRANGRTIEISKRDIEDISDENGEAYYTLVHEIQHLIQKREGFAPGGTPEYAREALGNRLKNDPELSKMSDEDLYWNLAGEQEARYSEDRAELYDQLSQALEDKADAEENIAEAQRNKDEKAEDDARKALFVARMQELQIRRKLEALPTPHDENALVIYGGETVGKVSGSNGYAQNTYLQSAWHGSGAQFTEFDLGAIGTGEGAQVHGWGLYFAQNREVAEGYKNRLGEYQKEYVVKFNGNTYISDGSFLWQNENGEPIRDYSYLVALSAIREAKGDKSAAQRDIRDRIRSERATIYAGDNEIALDIVTNGDFEYSENESVHGSLFQVEIPDDDVLLDEQKTFAEQPPKVRKAIENLVRNLTDEQMEDTGEDVHRIGRKKAAENILAMFNDSDGKGIYNTLSDTFGGQREVSEALNQYGIKGITYVGGTDGRCFVVFNDKAIKIIDTYNKKVNGEVKGEYNPENNIITLFKGADASTVIHETWHFFVEQMWQSVKDGSASEQAVKDFDTLLNYAGMTREGWAAANIEGRRNAHEKLAEAGETYIMEGKAPSFELRRVFKNFAKWLKAVYRKISRSENAAEITDEVREVFDRMLAAEDDIAQMERVNGYFSKLPDAITENMSDETRMKVEDFIVKAREKAEDILTRRYLRNYVKDRREQIKKFKEEIRPIVEEEVSKRPVYACGVTKKDVNKYRDIQKQKQEFYKISGGTPFAFRHSEEAAYLMEMDLRAEQNGFSSADEMMKAVEAAPTRSEAVKRRINERVRELSPESERDFYENAIHESLYNEDEALLIGVEQQLIEEYAKEAKAKQIERQQEQAVKDEQREQAKAERKARNAEMAAIAAAKRQQAKVLAQEEIAKMNVKDAMRTNRFIAAERNAAVKSAKLLAKKDFEGALAQKNLQAYWHAMVSESMKIKRRKAQYDKFLRKQLSLKPESWLNDTHFGAISLLFDRMGIAKAKHKEAAAASAFKTLQEYATAMEGQVDCVDIAPWILDGQMPINDINALTLEQYEDVINAVKNIKAIVKAQQGVNMFQQKEAFADFKTKVKEHLSALKTVWTPDPNTPTKAGKLERQAAAMENTDTLFERLDNATFGFFSNIWGNAIKHGNDLEYEKRSAYDKAISDAVKKWLPDKDAEARAGEKVHYDELGTSVTKHTLVQMLCNLGNKENAQRLCETVPVGFENNTLWVLPDESLAANAKQLAEMRREARETTRQNLIEFLGKVLTKEDVEYAQAKIDAAEKFWPEREALDRRTKGFAPRKVEATPIMLSIGGETVVLKGGYFPLIRNGETGSHAAGQEVSDGEPLQGRRIRTYHTNTGASKARTGARYPVALFAGAETNWIYESIHDICWRETMSDFRRVLNDQELFGMLKSKMGVARMNNFKELLEVCADPRNSKSISEGEAAIGEGAAWLQRRTTHAVIMCNLKVASQNFANVLLYGNTVPGYTMGDSVRALGHHMLSYFSPERHGELVEFVTSKSAFMRERMELPDFTLRDIVEGGKEYAWEKTAREIGVKAMAFTDNATAIPNWIEAYTKKLNEEGTTEQEAIDYADALVRRVLGSSRFTDVASIQRGNPVFRLLTMFQSFFNARYNEFVRTKNVAERQWSEGDKQKAFGTLFSYAVSKWLMNVMLSMTLALQNPFGTDDDDKWPELLKELKSYTGSMFGIPGQIGSYAIGSFLNMKEFDYRLSAVESTIEKVGRAGKKIHSGKATAAEKIEGVTDVAGLALGVPAQFNRIFWNAYDAAFNGMTPELGDLFRRRPKKERK